MSENLPNRTLPVSKAASFLAVPAEPLRRWDRKGILKPFRTKGGQRRYSLTNLEAYKSGERSAKTPLKISQAAEQLGVQPENRVAKPHSYLRFLHKFRCGQWNNFSRALPIVF